MKQSKNIRSHSSMRDALIMKSAIWYGYLTRENAEAIAQRMHNILDGHYFCFIENYTPSGSTRIRSSQRLQPIRDSKGTLWSLRSIYREDEDDYASIDVHDDYGSWWISTNRDAYIIFDEDQLTIQQQLDDERSVTYQVIREYHTSDNRPTDYEREEGGKLVRAAWMEWAAQQPSPKESWLVPWEQLSEADKDADRHIWQRIIETERNI